MACTFHDVEIGTWPGLVQLPGIFQWAGHVVAPVDADTRTVLELVRVTHELPFFQPARMHEVVVFDAGEGDRIVRVVELRGIIRIRQERDRLALPYAPGNSAFA